MDKNLVECFKALGDPIRFRIFNSLKNKTICACEFTQLLDLEVSQPTLSFHLKKLRDCGLIIESKEGTRKIMSINQDMVSLIQEYWKI
jgi:ArsR family transcriptional regulator, arsenate/arsenite/antimonite-responsive transcriptional repressor